MLSKHFSREEFEFSQTAVRLGIDNTIPESLLDNAKRTAEIMEIIRAGLGGRPIKVSSGYRGVKLNAVIPNSSKTSAHTLALACDFTCASFGSVYDTTEAVSHILDDFDQLIYEFGRWVHIGLSEGHQRKEIITATFNNGRVFYHKGLLSF